MLYEIVEIQEVSGAECSIYSVILKGGKSSLFDQFIDENDQLYKIEINEISEKLFRIGNELGARAQYFKINEGKPGDLLCTLYDEPEKNLRLFCIRFGMNILILGGGGFKSKEIRAWQEDPELAKEGNLMIRLAEHIGKRLEKREDLWLSGDQCEIEGDLKNYNDEEDE